MTAAKDRALELARRYVAPHRVDVWDAFDTQLVIGRRKGYMIWDLSGHALVDLHLNGGTFNLGHRHPEIVAALVDAAASLDIGNHHFASVARAELGERLAELTPGRLAVLRVLRGRRRSQRRRHKDRPLRDGPSQDRGAGGRLPRAHRLVRRRRRGRGGQDVPFGPARRLHQGPVHRPAGDERCAQRRRQPGGATVLIDFDDCGFGWYVYELAVALFPYDRDERFKARRNALVAGYRRVAPLSDVALNELPTFLMARRLATLGWTFSHAETDHARHQRAWRMRTFPDAAHRFLSWYGQQEG